MKLSKKVLDLQTSTIRRLFELGATVKKPLDLSLGVPAFDIPDGIKKAAVKEILSNRKGYSVNAGHIDVRKKIASKLRRRNNIQAEADEIIITSGVTGGLWMALAGTLDAGDEIITFDPYFVAYKSLIEFIGAKQIKVSTYPKWEIPFSELESKITAKTKAILFNNPNNPTGKVYGSEDLIRLGKIAEKNNLWIISDEVYEDLIYDQSSLDDRISIGSVYKNTITLMGPSKSASLAGYRIAYLHSSKDTALQLNKLQQIFYVCAPLVSQAALSKSLDLNPKAMRIFYKEKRDLVKEILGDYAGLEGAFYAFLPVIGGDSERVSEELIKEKVLVVPGNAFSDFNTHLRISYSVPNNKLIAALKIIKKYLV